MGFSRQEKRNELSYPSPGDPPDSGVKPVSLPPALAGGFFTTNATSSCFLQVLMNLKHTVLSNLLKVRHLTRNNSHHFRACVFISKLLSNGTPIVLAVHLEHPAVPPYTPLSPKPPPNPWASCISLSLKMSVRPLVSLAWPLPQPGLFIPEFQWQSKFWSLNLCSLTSPHFLSIFYVPKLTYFENVNVIVSLRVWNSSKVLLCASGT